LKKEMFFCLFSQPKFIFMLIVKFGGTSVGKPERMHSIAKLVNDGKKKIVVLSALSGTTNSLVEIGKLLYANNYEKAEEAISKLENHYLQFIGELLSSNEFKTKANNTIAQNFSLIRGFCKDLFNIFKEKVLLAQGELMSTALFQIHLEEQKIKSALLPALNFMRVDKDNEPDLYYVTHNLNNELEKHPNCNLFITQGYICRNAYGEVDNLKRGGSDYSASIIGNAINASEIQIWTDIDGMHNNDPRIVKKTYPIRELSFDEAAELAYFGAKILHPASIRPAKDKNIPVLLKNTLEPDAQGTIITSESKGNEIKAVAAKDGITAIKIKSGRMLLAYGFLRRVFEVFERYKTPIDMITTSEVAVSVTIDDTGNLKNIIEELQSFGTVEIDENQAIICIVGDFLAEKRGMVLKVIESLKEIPIRMISYGGSKNNVSFLISAEHKVTALEKLNQGVFNLN
jgi:aspartate kinase